MHQRTRPPVPLPTDWTRLHELLRAERRRMVGSSIPEPPTPLILAGAAFSTASAIRARWAELLDWASTYGFETTLTNHLPPAPEHDVANAIAGVSDSGQGWWPEYGLQVHAPKPRPSPVVAHEAMERLCSSWVLVVGQDLGHSTKPIRLSGRKLRNLVVAADPKAKAPWGSWCSASSNPSAFSAFRKAINALLTPVEVDHVSFNTDVWRGAV